MYTSIAFYECMVTKHECDLIWIKGMVILQQVDFWMDVDIWILLIVPIVVNLTI